MTGNINTSSASMWVWELTGPIQEVNWVCLCCFNGNLKIPLPWPWKFVKVKVTSLSPVRLFASPWTVAHQAPPSIGFSRQEYWSGLLFPSPGDLPDPGIEPGSPVLQADALTSEPPGKPTLTLGWWLVCWRICLNNFLAEVLLCALTPQNASLSTQLLLSQQ